MVSETAIEVYKGESSDTASNEEVCEGEHCVLPVGEGLEEGQPVDLFDVVNIIEE